MSKKDEAETTRRQEELLRWLFEFQELDVESIRIRDAQRKLKELVVVECFFARKVLLTDWIERHKSGQTMEVVAVRLYESRFRREVPQPTKSEIRTMHKWLRGVLEEVRPSSVKKENLRLPYIPYWRESDDEPLFSGRPRRYFTEDFKRLYTVDAEDLYVASIEALLEEFGPRIARCEVETCPKLFLRVRRQRYCSPACSQAVQSVAWYERHKETIRARRRKRYQDSVRGKTHAKVKVGRRKSD